MPKQSPIPDDIDGPFWAACNQERLRLQKCLSCDSFQHPPRAACRWCESSSHLHWQEISGRGTIYSYAVVYDTPVELLALDQPFNAAVITLDEAPGVNMISHLPGTPVDRVPIGERVELIFERTAATGQKVPEWRVIDPAS